MQDTEMSVTSDSCLSSGWDVLPVPAAALGESPFWHPGEERLYWVDIQGRLVWRASESGENAQFWSMPSEPGCIAPALRGGLVIGLRHGIYRAAFWSAPLDLLAEAPYEAGNTRVNDGKCDMHGRLWFSSVYEPKDARLAALYSIEGYADGTVGIKRHAGGAMTGNGVAWSPDGRTLYWSDTPSHTIYAWAFEVATGQLSNRRVFKQFEAKPDGWQPGDAGYGGRPDGAAVDTEGHLWVAMYEGARVVRLSPEGELVQSIPVPARCPTMPAFGGKDRQTLFVTSASHGRSAQELSELPLSGKVFKRRVGVAGLPANFFRGRQRA